MPELLYIANVRIPTEKAHGFQIMTMCKEFATFLPVHLLVPTRQNPIQADPFSFYHVPKVFQLTRIPTPDPRWALKLPGGWYIKIQGLFFTFSLWRNLKKQPIDAIAYTRDEYLLPMLLRTGRKVVWECHALPSSQRWLKKILKRCHAIVVLTTQLRQQLVALGLPEGKIIVSPDAVDRTLFDVAIDMHAARQKLGLPAEGTILGYTGSFTTKGMDKGIDDILRAQALLREQGRRYLFIAIGGSPTDIERYQQSAAEYGVTDMVIFKPPVTQDVLAIFQKACDVVLMPFPNTPHYAYYMSPLKMFEYMVSQRPIIASDLPSIRDVLDESMCYFCQPGDPASLASVINDVVEHPSGAQVIADRAYQMSEKYTWSARAKNIIEKIIQ